MSNDYTFRYVNGVVRGSPGYLTPCEIAVRRNEPILTDPEKVKVAVERFYLHGVPLPLFDGSKVWKIGLRDHSASSGSPITSVQVRWSEDYFFDYAEMVPDLNLALSDVATTVGLNPDDIPTFSFDRTSGIFSITTSSSFRGQVDLFFGEDMTWGLNTFQHEGVDNPGWYKIILNDDTATQSNATLELLSPVDVIALRTSGLPVEYELMPPPASVQNDITDDIGSFLVDFKYTQSNNQAIQPILYSVSGSDHRYHNLLRTGKIQDFTVKFFWVDYAGTFHPINLPASAIAELKLMFVK